MRPVYVVEKVFATFGVFSLIYTITEYYILPYMPVPGESLLKAYMELAVPMIVNYLLYVANLPNAIVRADVTDHSSRSIF